MTIFDKGTQHDKGATQPAAGYVEFEWSVRGGTSPGVCHHAYEQYHLGSHTHSGASVGQADAFAVRDQLLVLPLGLAVAQ